MPQPLNKDNNKIAVFCEEVLELESAKLLMNIITQVFHFVLLTQYFL